MGASREDINYHIDEFNKRFPDRAIPRIDGGYHLSGFTHPEVPIFVYTEEAGLELRPMQWGTHSCLVQGCANCHQNLESDHQRP